MFTKSICGSIICIKKPQRNIEYTALFLCFLRTYMVQELSLIFPAYFANKAEQIQFANYVVYVIYVVQFFSKLSIRISNFIFRIIAAQNAQ